MLMERAVRMVAGATGKARISLIRQPPRSGNGTLCGCFSAATKAVVRTASPGAVFKQCRLLATKSTSSDVSAKAGLGEADVVVQYLDGDDSGVVVFGLNRPQAGSREPVPETLRKNGFQF